ncbi:MAG: toxic anion resistance protein [Thauera sp.]|nr:toxic anion resistance protein [Thauera sp.]
MSLPLLSFSSPLFEAPAGEQGGGGGSAAKAQPRSGLSLPPIEDIAREVVPPQPEEAPEDPQLAATADAFVRDALAADEAALHRQREAVDSMGIELQRQAAWRSEMLQAPIRKLAHQGDEGGPVAQALLALRDKMVDLDPSRQKLSGEGLSRALAFIPGVGKPMQRYFQKYEKAQDALDAIIGDLQGGADMLRRDNLTLADDQQSLRAILTQLDRQVEIGRMIDRRLVREAASATLPAPRRAFVEEELLFPLRQRIVDLQQQVAVSQQGVLALEVVIRNNRELIRGVDRAINVTVSALNVAVTVALGLANQRLVLDRVAALNQTTSALIAGTAQALRTQGVDIQTRAASTMLDMGQLEQAFADVLGAIDDLSRYRREALPKLDAQIDRLAALASQGGEAIRRMDEGNRAEPVP